MPKPLRSLPTVLALLALACGGGSVDEPAVGPDGAPVAQAPDDAEAGDPDPGEPDRAESMPGDQITLVELRLGQTTAVRELRLRWLELNDSRCPRGVQCVWEGEAVATIELSGEGLETRIVELRLRPGAADAARAVAGYRLLLESVEPYPVDGVTPERADYLATVAMRPV